MVQLVHAGQFDLVPKISNLGTGISQGMQMANQFQEGKQKRLEDTQEQARLRAVAIDSGVDALKALPIEERPAAFEQMKGNLSKAGIDASVLTDLDYSDESLGRTKASLAPLIPDNSQEMTAKEREMQYLFKAGGLNEQERKAAIRTDLGIIPRAGTSAIERMAGNPVLATNVAEVKRQQAEESAIGKGKGETSVIAEKEFQSLLGKEGGKIYANLQNAAQSASAFIPRLESLRKLASTVTTGTGAEIKLMAKKALGIDSADMEELNAKLGELAQDILNQQTGTKTDFDFQNAVRQSASLGKTPEANARLIEALIARQEQAVRFGDMAKDAMRKGGVQAVLDLRYSAPAKGADVESLINKYAD